jgi:RNA polymerase sigma-32 factor
MTHSIAPMQFLPSGGLNAYLAWVHQLPILSHDQETELANRMIEQQDRDAVKQLILANLRHVAYIAQQYKGYGLSLSDLIQEGNIGLIKAVKRFNPKEGVRLVTYAAYWIKSEVHEYVLRNWKIVRVATTKVQRMLFFKLRSKLSFDTAVSEKEAGDIAQTLGVQPSDIIDMQKRLQYDHSLDVPVDDDENHWTDHQLSSPTLIQGAPDAVSSDLDAIKVNENLYAAIKALPERLCHIIQARYLMEEKMTLQALSDHLGVSVERVRQLEKQALVQMKKIMND